MSTFYEFKKQLSDKFGIPLHNMTVINAKN